MRDEGDELRRTNKLLLDELQASRDDNEKLKSELQTTLCLDMLASIARSRSLPQRRCARSCSAWERQEHRSPRAASITE